MHKGFYQGGKNYTANKGFNLQQECKVLMY